MEVATLDIWISPNELAQGKFEFPKISKTTQANLRARKKITYVLVANKVLYKKEWIEAYINANIRSVKNNNMENTHEK
jgi:hypothetical protein